MTDVGPCHTNVSRLGWFTDAQEGKKGPGASHVKSIFIPVIQPLHDRLLFGSRRRAAVPRVKCRLQALGTLPVIIGSRYCHDKFLQDKFGAEKKGEAR